MRKIAAGLVLWLIASVASAHKDRILPIGADGTLGVIPAAYGPVRVRVSRAAPSAITQVVVTSPRFNITLNQCILSKLRGVTHIQASGSWYHTRGSSPPYASLTFYSGKYDPRSPTGEYYSVTFSLLDGHILMGQRAWDPLIGTWRARVIDPADKCSHWRRLGMWPNNSFKPKPLRGSA
jgi:hypothetical protein